MEESFGFICGIEEVKLEWFGICDCFFLLISFGLVVKT
jgi:hypothetical protein